MNYFLEIDLAIKLLKSFKFIVDEIAQFNNGDVFI